jgi:hypothetical protein
MPLQLGSPPAAACLASVARRERCHVSRNSLRTASRAMLWRGGAGGFPLPRIRIPLPRRDGQMRARVNTPQDCTIPTKAMKKFEAYVKDLEAKAKEALRNRLSDEAASELPVILNGGVAHALELRATIAARQRLGAFFTGPQLRDRAFQIAGGRTEPDHVTWDPACGAGDLLLGASAQLPVKNTLTETVRHWRTRLTGIDIQPIFIRAARARLVLAAYERGARNQRGRAFDLQDCFSRVTQGNALKMVSIPRCTGLIVVNPPFTTVPAPRECQWAGGGVSAAALFVEMCMRNALAGTHIVAILPDVLRSGSRYSAWRQMVAERAVIHRSEMWGSFHPNVDVDVFLLHLSVGCGRVHSPEGSVCEPWFGNGLRNRSSLADRCSVTVGAVVPHRHPETGPASPFLYPRVARSTAVDAATLPVRRFSGKLHTPPFVAVRRTSSPADRRRIVATIVTGSAPVAVENHFIVLTPYDGRLQTCESIHAILSARTTATWMNQRIRCRHLTTAAVGAIPTE